MKIGSIANALRTDQLPLPPMLPPIEDLIPDQQPNPPTCVRYFGETEADSGEIDWTDFNWVEYNNPGDNDFYLRTPTVRAKPEYQVYTQAIPPSADFFPPGKIVFQRVGFHLAVAKEEPLKNESSIHLILETQKPEEKEPVIIYDRNFGSLNDHGYEWQWMDGSMTPEETEIFNSRVRTEQAYSRLHLVANLPRTFQASDYVFLDNLTFELCFLQQPEAVYLPLLSSLTAGSGY